MGARISAIRDIMCGAPMIEPVDLGNHFDPGIALTAKQLMHWDGIEEGIEVRANKGIFRRVAAVVGLLAASTISIVASSKEVAANDCVPITVPGGNITGWDCRPPDPQPAPRPDPTPAPDPQPAPRPDPAPAPRPAPRPNPTTTVNTDPDDDRLAFPKDNCDYVYNPGQENADGDVHGDVCDENIDNDKKLNGDDPLPYDNDHDDDRLHDLFDPNVTNSDIDDDEFLDGDPTEIIDKGGDGTLDLLQSRVDGDGDGTTAETGDSNESNPCTPNNNVAACDKDKDQVPDVFDLEANTEAGAKVDANGVTVTTTTTRAVLAATTQPRVTTSVAPDTTLPEQSGNTTEVQVVAGGNDSDNTPDTNAGAPNNESYSWWVPAAVAGGIVVGGIFILLPIAKRRSDEKDAPAGKGLSGSVTP